MSKRKKKKKNTVQVNIEKAPKKVEAEIEEIEAIKEIEKKAPVEKETHRHRNRMSNCILFILIAASMLLFSLYGLLVSYYGNYEFQISMDRPAFVSVLLNEKDINDLQLAQEDEAAGEELSSEMLGEEATDAESEAASEEATTSEETSEEETVSISPELAAEFQTYYGEEPYIIGDDEITYYVGWNDNISTSKCYINPGVRAVSTIYDYKKVDPTYFDNSAFIGDSRIEGLHSYSGWENATFLYKRGLTVYSMMDKEVNLNTGLRTTVMQALSERQFENIYIMVGINELGGGNDKVFADKYRENIELIRSMQPDARIIIMSIMFETKAYSDSKPVFNNDNINAKNAAIAKLANGKDIFYLDVNPCIADPETGVMPEEYSFDGVHMKAQYYSYWVDYMYAHGY